MMIPRVRECLSAYEPVRVVDPLVPRAAVAMILRSRGEDAEVLLIRRAERASDPWSGHMALPGGRREPADPDLVRTAVRETREEVGLDLGLCGEVLGALDDLHAVARDRPVDLVISPFVFAVEDPGELRLDPKEVEQVMWVRLSFLRGGAARAVHRRRVDGVEIDFPAYLYQGHIIWGLTHRVVDQFLGLISP